MNSKDGSSFRDSALNFNGDDEEGQQFLEGPKKTGEIDPIGSELDQEKGELGKRKESTRGSLQEIDRIRSELDQAKEDLCRLKDSTRNSFSEEERKQLLEALRKDCEIDGIKSELDQVKEELRNSKKSNASRSLPQDTYSMMMIPFSGARVTVFSSFIFLFQVGLLALIIVDFSDGPAFVPMFNPPPDVSPEVRASQFFAIVIALVTQEDTIASLTVLLSLCSTERWNAFYTKFQSRESTTSEEPVVQRRHGCCCFWYYAWCCFGLCMIMTPHQVYYASNGLRLSQGLLGLFVSMIIIIQSYSIIDLFKDFAAMAFISTLDNVAFSLANRGFFGTSLSNNAEKVMAAELPELTRRSRIVRGAILFFLFGGMLIGWSFIVHHQLNGEWLPQSITVQFGDNEDFAIQAYSGIYERNERDVVSGGWSVSNGLAMVPLSYISIFPNDCSDDAECGLETSQAWPKRTGFCNRTSSRCECSYGFYGEKCQFMGPCRSLEVLDNNTEFEGFPSSFSAVENVTFHSEPVYTNYEDADDYDLVVFAGRRWIIVKKSHAFDHLDEYYKKTDKDASALESCRNSSLFSGDMFHEAMRFTELLHSVQFVSEPTIGGTPNGLQWYKRLARDPTGHALLVEQIDATFNCSLYGFQYCTVEYPWLIGDGMCHSAAYNTEQCGWDGGDCVEFNRLYPNCTVVCLSCIGDGECDGAEFNTEQCGWDGGDCIVEGYPDCHFDDPSRIGDGRCHGGQFNTEECGWDGGDCVEFNRLYPNCTVEDPSYIGDGVCDVGGYNTAECGYDGGDCCQASCIPGEEHWQCTGPWDHCVDPNYSQRN